MVQVDHELCNSLAVRARAGDEEAETALMQMMYSVAAAVAHDYHPPRTMSYRDMTQVGMIGIIEALRNWSCTGRFRGWASFCARRQILQEIKYHSRLQRKGQQEARSLDEPDPDKHRDDMAESRLSRRILTDTSGLARNPLDVLTAAGDVAEMQLVLQELVVGLSDLEAEVFDRFFLQRQPYKQIAHEMKRSDSAIDNALQRVRRKAERNADRLAHDDRLSPETQAIMADVGSWKRSTGPRMSKLVGLEEIA